MNENESANAINLCHVRRSTCVSVGRSCCGLIIVQNHHPDLKYNDLALWDYTGLPATFGCRDWFTARAATNVELDKAMEKASQHLSQHSPVRHRTICTFDSQKNHELFHSLTVTPRGKRYLLKKHPLPAGSGVSGNNFPRFSRKNNPGFSPKTLPCDFSLTMVSGWPLFSGQTADRPGFCAFSLPAKEAGFFRVKSGISGK